MSRVASLLAAGAALVLAACGAGGGGASGPERQFTSLGCASCHTLRAAGATGRVGPVLDKLRPDAATVARQVRNGGKGMPSYRGRLSEAEIRALAEYVARAARRSG